MFVPRAERRGDCRRARMTHRAGRFGVRSSHRRPLRMDDPRAAVSDTMPGTTDGRRGRISHHDPRRHPLDLRCCPARADDTLLIGLGLPRRPPMARARMARHPPSQTQSAIGPRGCADHARRGSAKRANTGRAGRAPDALPSAGASGVSESPTQARGRRVHWRDPAARAPVLSASADSSSSAELSSTAKPCVPRRRG